MLYAISALVKTHRDDLAHWLVQESGKPIDASLLELDRVATTFRLSAEEALRDVGEVQAVDLSARNKNFRALYERFPIGPISAITPFNFPLNLSAHKIGPAFAAGNPVVLKPPVQCPAILIHFARIIQQAGVPDGALNVIHCHPPVAERLATDDRFKLLSFTGSARVGWHLKSIAGRKRVLLELGGNAGPLSIRMPTSPTPPGCPRRLFRGPVCINLKASRPQPLSLFQQALSTKPEPYLL